MMVQWSKWWIAGVAVAAAGCTPAPQQQVVGPQPGIMTGSNQPPPPLQVVNPGGEPVAGQGQSTESPDDAIHSDPSAMRMDDIVEALLLYLKANGGMPARLEDLQTVPMIGPSINAVSPSGAPYAYVPQGLTAPNSNKRLVVYDPLESTNGKRWCILVSQSQAGGPLTAEVLHLPEIVFRAYLASGEQQ
jgi:hypothetical protein